MSYLERMISVLDELADLRIAWPRGLMHRGGPHRRLVGNISPISIGEDECAVFGRLIETLEPETCFIVGNAFGFSSVYIALAMQDHGGREVVTLDAETEGDGSSCAWIARELTERIDLPILTNKKGFSPQDVPGAVGSDHYDLIFIDGYHGHPAVTDDFYGTLPYAHDETVFVWHDFWFAGVRHSVARALEEGFRCLWIPTSCEMVLGTRSPERFERLRERFPAGDDDPLRHFHPARYILKWTIRSVPIYLAVFGERLRRRPALPSKTPPPSKRNPS